MNTKLIIATISGAILAFLLGWLVYGIILMDFMEANTIQYEGFSKEPNFLLMIISMLSSWFFISWVFQRWAGFETFMKGLYGGMMFGFFFAVSFDLFLYAMANLYTAQFIIVDIIVSTILNGLIGGVVAMILGYKATSHQPR